MVRDLITINRTIIQVNEVIFKFIVVYFQSHTILLCVAPGSYVPERVNLDQSPAYSFGTKINHDRPNNNPAPGAYEPEKVNLDQSLGFSFGSRVNHDKPSETPAPCAYNPEKPNHNPSFSFGVKPILEKISQTPGIFIVF